MAKFNKKLIGINIITARTYKKISQTALCKSIGISNPTLCNIEAGKTYPRMDIMIKIAEVLEKDLNWFVVEH